MKSLLFVFSLLVVAGLVRCKPPEELLKFFEECRSELGLPNEKQKGLHNPDDSQAKCFHACLLAKLGELVDGKIVLEKAIENHMKRPNWDDGQKDGITECANTANQESDKCDVAVAMGECVHDKFAH